MTDHPKAADTSEGIRSWWVAPEFSDSSSDDVQIALDHLVSIGRLCRSVVADGTIIYAAADPAAIPPKKV
ncbi:hypothetical protein IVB30_20165 [Bradyrhizobium sp. 200]|uniref:hypothetical protein n=1 Tax=Bradyrhizobium sp. 200 TaxID=2782665 RepID=UPI001FFE4343|nr:hypothetical protein [Bradyrhizobium sp. 200]UPJ53423.1 hypothetical protein IVB30_20165 [Bradyrhizobium sp. 200]